MGGQLQSGNVAHARGFRISHAAVLALSMAIGASLCFTLQSSGSFLCHSIVLAAACLLLLYPEVALAAYVVIGDVKGNESVASLIPVDLTLALGAVLLAGIALNLLRGRRPLPPPRVYFLFPILILMMAASLLYTPGFEAGLEKFGRFLTVTGIVIVAPFLALTTPAAMKRFFIAFGAAATGICAWSLTSLGDNRRLVSPSDNTIGLGHIACALFVLIWVGIASRYSFPHRALAYPLLAVPALALVGSASRGSLIACLLAVVLTIVWNRRLLLDVACLIAIGFSVVPFIGIPRSSISYLATLVQSRSVGQLLNFRADLLAYGWNLLEKHPLIGAGLGGFRYSSPNPTLYKWPHNIFLEIACELGIPAALLAIAIFASAIKESIRQLRDRRFPYASLSQVAAALLLVGLVNSVNTGNINSDRATWLFVSLVFVVRALHESRTESVRVRIPALARP